jgi:hypothetical protein
MTTLSDRPDGGLEKGSDDWQYDLYWQYQAAPGRTAGVTETKDVTFRGLG